KSVSGAAWRPESGKGSQQQASRECQRPECGAGSARCGSPDSAEGPTAGSPLRHPEETFGPPEGGVPDPRLAEQETRAQQSRRGGSVSDRRGRGGSRGYKKRCGHGIWLGLATSRLPCPVRCECGGKSNSHEGSGLATVLRRQRKKATAVPPPPNLPPG